MREKVKWLKLEVTKTQIGITSRPPYPQSHSPQEGFFLAWI